MKVLQITSIILGIVVTLPTFLGVIFTAFSYWESFIALANLCSDIDCIKAFEDINTKVDYLWNKEEMSR